MKKSYLFLFVGLSIQLCVVCSCTKDTKTSNYDLLTNNGGIKQWIYTAISDSRNVPQQLRGCDVDDTYTFNRSGDYAFSYGTEKCGTRELDHAGNWTLTDNDRVIVLHEKPGMKLSKLRIVSISDSQLIVVDDQNSTQTFTSLN